MRARPPDFVIGPASDPYIRRWWLIPRNRFFNIYLHNIIRDDDDRALHDHPWINCSIVLKGVLREITPKGAFIRMPWDVVFRRAVSSHRLEVIEAPVWTLFITGPVIRSWGFHCPKGWVPWRQFVNPDNVGETGRGCGES
jgi:hypothetical protein